ncbi:hypothetical protein KUH32_18245 [Thalassococcus sp. CAU 1522]|uniref:Reverse transcriptase domain-containing protein n=1 Tax=Thalassococcus arenae TaxID=2851652 RepID=A0ABS6NCF8_9RHOB|nr:reverse transcriptase domain-containing protein [Thalassococcus arenae]MBV2361711.1 hypothetical protein [Thalassococcus arenae]
MPIQIKPKPYDGFQNQLGYYLPLHKHQHASLPDHVKTANRAIKRAAKLKRRVRNAAHKNHSEYTKACETYLKSFDARIEAVCSVNKSKPLAKRTDLGRCILLAEKMNLWAPQAEIARVHQVPRGTPNRYRWIWSFQLRSSAAQLMVSQCIRALMPPPEEMPWLFTDRGVQAAIAKMIALIEDGNVWVAELDISEFYPSVAKSKVLPKLPFKKVVERVAFATTAIPRKPDGSLLSIGCVSSARRGAPQGAKTSAAITTWIMTHLSHNLPNDVHLIVYADNLFLISTTRQKVEVAAKSLGAAVAALPGGSFKVKPPQIENAHDGVTALGHAIYLIDGNVIGHPNNANLQRYHARIDAALVSCSTLFNVWCSAKTPKTRGLLLAELAGIKRYVKFWHAFFPDDFYASLPEGADPAWVIDLFMHKHGIGQHDIVGWENGKVRIASNPSRMCFVDAP